MAATFEILADDACSDIKAHPWKYPGYALYMGLFITPLPVPGNHIILASILLGWAELGLTPGARALKTELKLAFNGESLMQKFSPFLEKTATGEKVKAVALSRAAVKQTIEDMKISTAHTWKSIKQGLHFHR